MKSLHKNKNPDTVQRHSSAHSSTKNMDAASSGNSACTFKCTRPKTGRRKWGRRDATPKRRCRRRRETLNFILILIKTKRQGGREESKVKATKSCLSHSTGTITHRTKARRKLELWKTYDQADDFTHSNLDCSSIRKVPKLNTVRRYDPMTALAKNYGDQKNLLCKQTKIPLRKSRGKLNNK